MKLKLIACEVLTREVSYCAARTPHTIDIEFTPKNAHDRADNLRAMIQEKIMEASKLDYDAILLGIGLCGNATAGIYSLEKRLVIPRAHDCCTLFLGSLEKFREIFEHRPSTAFTSVGYMERDGDLIHDSTDFLTDHGLKESLDEYVKIYGEENGQYLWNTLHTSKDKHSNELVYIEIPEFADLGYAKQCQQLAEEKGKTMIPVQGSMEIIRKLLFAEWDEEDFLVLEPGEKIEARYDWKEIVTSSKIKK